MPSLTIRYWRQFIWKSLWFYVFCYTVCKFSDLLSVCLLSESQLYLRVVRPMFGTIELIYTILFMIKTNNKLFPSSTLGMVSQLTSLLATKERGAVFTATQITHLSKFELWYILQTPYYKLLRVVWVFLVETLVVDVGAVVVYPGVVAVWDLGWVGWWIEVIVELGEVDLVTHLLGYVPLWLLGTMMCCVV